MESKQFNKLIEANANAMRRVAALLEAVASLVETRGEAVTTQPEQNVQTAPLSGGFDPHAPTRRMPAMEQQALALDEAVRGVAVAAEKLQPASSPLEIPLPEVTTVRIVRPEQMIELMEKLREPPGGIVEVEPVPPPITQKMGSRDS